MERYCECGCLGLVNPNNKVARYIQGHATRGRKLTEEQKKRIGDHHRGKIVSEATRQKLREHYLGTTKSEAHKKAISEAMKKIPGHPHDEETKKKISQIKKREWARGVFKNTGINYSSQEIKLAPVVAKLGFRSTIKKRKYIHNDERTRVPDFYNPKTKEIIEIFGEYWHRDRKLPEGKRHETPEEVIAWYASLGWHCTVVWATEEFDEFYDRMAKLADEKKNL